ncbi:MAG: hypothetical protein LBI84_10250 [Propionibacteriaceae bacterium]|nr:hypothetical protein [Propionibacteriaceae bacterium]
MAGLAGLTGCDDKPEPAWTPPPRPTVSRSSTPTPSPTPTELVPAPDDPSWNTDQLAAAHIVDAYIEVLGEFTADPANADTSRLLDVATDPQYSEIVGSVAALIQIGRHFEFSGGTYVIPVARAISEEKTVNGIRQITVSQCDADNPTTIIVDPDGPQPPGGLPRVQYHYTVQWVEEAAGWRVAEVGRAGGGEAWPC